ncbi:MAG: PilT/PilU family type 4a pilus ATPase [Candidatus Omnitrophica bacterium]|nr:PilT/PilU family type 4a pilus ATPase [Candidatus Omnitrophota bacterium]
MSADNLSDRKKSYRVYAQIPITCEIIDPTDKTIRKKSALVRNISSEDVYFEIDEILPLGTEVNIAFQLPRSENVITSTIKISRVEATESETIFGAGAYFVKISDTDREEIRQLVERLDIYKLLELTIKKGASDLHILANQQPVLRIQGEVEMLDYAKLYAEDIPNLLYSIMTKQQIKKFEQDKELDFALQYDMQNRFRINIHQQRGFLEATLRRISTKIHSFDELNLPEVIRDLARQKEGLVLIVGPTGSGKTTTIAAMLDIINNERKGVIITLERPIEYVYSNIKCIIKQREVGIDTNSFSTALKSTLRQDPNIIVVGEIDDVETVRTAIIAAESGHLVIASFHAPNTVQAIDRLTSLFPIENRKHILFQLSRSLKGIVCQLLIPTKNRQDRVLATEIVIVTDALRNIIRNDELFQIPTIIQTGGALRMQSMQQSIKRYLDQGIIDAETAIEYSEEFNR